jgi:hypothetical protein
LAGLAWGAACASAEQPLPPLAPAVSSPRWERLAAASQWPEAAPPFASRGHGAGFIVTVRVEPAGLEAYRGIVSGGVFAEGTSNAVFHRDSAGTAGSIYAMEKRSGAWRFTAANADGTLLEGDLGLCRRCHDDSPADHVFGAPRPRDGD